MSEGESDDGKRASKKRKASRACDRCNSQHQPCDNAIPKCSVCARANTDCTYNRPVRKRGPRSGYTGQNGERLWAVVLRAKPELEDVVLQILRGDTYGNTGISNVEYFRNNDNQTELVNRFNESRLGRYLQNGESSDLLLPPVEQHLSPGAPQADNQNNFTQPSTYRRQPDLTGAMHTRSNRSVSSASASHSAIVNPHGAPQNPGDIYVQSDDIRKRIFQPIQSQDHSYRGDMPEGSSQDVGLDRASTALTAPQTSATPYGSNGSIDGYGDYSHQANGPGMMERQMGLNQSRSIPLQPQQPMLNNSGRMAPNNQEFGLDDTSRWLDSVPFDTLRNLGFAPGEGMAEDFLELCENPDPVQTIPNAPLNQNVNPNVNQNDNQNEDQEAIWRRLIMRGRFS
ncbi:hypothetical protein F5B20DRAFT_548346 [Whalleya microplaca]|nr:hypothetical protein F5B20DRAFT_548346 [Whalleya microplaca]